MADSPSSKPAAASNRPTLLPQAEHAGKPAMPLGAHQFTLIGARNRAHLHLLSSTISRNHACIITGRSGVYVRDLASRNGVIVNGRKVRESELHDGDLMQVGSFKFKFQEPPGPVRLPSTPRPPLAMIEMDGRALTPMDERTILIGRRPGCDITLDSPAVSNTHAVIFESDGKRYVRDLGSRTGTQVNGNTVHQHAIEIGDQIKIGSTTLRYIAADMHAVEADESLPLELEPAALHEEIHAPADLHFEQPAAPELEQPAAVPHADLEPIPLIEPAAEHAELVAPHSVESSSEIEFPAEHFAEAASDLDAEEQTPLPVEEEIPAIQQDVTAPAAITPEPAEDLSVDAWTPPSEQTVTADAAAVEPEPVHEEPIAFEPELPTADVSPESAAEFPADDELAMTPLEQVISTPEEAAPVEQIPFEESPAPETISPTSASVETSAIEEIPADDEHSIATEESELPELSIPPMETTPSEELLVPTASEGISESMPDGIEPLAAEPEASPLNTTEEAVEPDLAESLESLQADQLPPEVTPSADEDAQLSVEEQSASMATDAIEEQTAPTISDQSAISADLDSLNEAPLAPDIESEVSVTEPVSQAESAEPDQTDLTTAEAASVATEEAQPAPEAHADDRAWQPEVVDPEPHATASPIGEPTATIDVIQPASELPPEIEATATESAEPQEITSTPIDEVDLSTVTFGADVTETEPTIDATPDAPTEPVPLLDLVPPTPKEPAEPEVAEPTAEAIESPVSGKKRASRSPRKKAARNRLKKSEAVTETDSAAPEQELTAPLAEATATEVAATGATPNASETGFVASQPVADIEPKTSVTTESLSPAESSETATTEPLPTSDEITPVASEGVASEKEEAAERLASEPEPAAEPFEAIAAEQGPKPVAAQSPDELERSEPMEASAVEAPHPTQEPSIAPELSQTLPESLSDFETADFHEPPAEVEHALTSSVPPSAAAAFEMETAEPIPSEPEQVVAEDSASALPVEASVVSEEASLNTEERLPETPVETLAEELPPSAETPVASDEASSGGEEAQLEAPIEAIASASVEAELPPLIEEELPPLPDEASELTSHLGFATPAEDASVSITEPPIETIEGTEPTPESALDIEPSLPELESEPAEMESVTHPDGLLSDTAFGEIVTDFASQETGPLVEETNVAPKAIAPSAQAPSGTRAGDSQLLAALGGADLPPLELGEAITFGSDEDETPPAEHQVDAFADELALDQSVATDSTELPAESEMTVPAGLEPVEPTLDLEPTPEIAAELTAPVVEEPTFDAGLEWEEPVGVAPQDDESGLEFEEPLTAAAQPSAESTAPETNSTSATPEQFAPETSFVSSESDAAPAMQSDESAPAPRTEATPPPPSRPAGPTLNPFFGMERDLGSFIGGMPLALGTPPPQAQSPKPGPATPVAEATATPALTPPAEGRATSATPPKSVAKVDAPITFDEQPKDEFDLDKLFEGEEPLELFDETAEQLDTLPDALEPIGDLGSAIGEPLNPAPAAAPASEISVARATPLRSLTADASTARPTPPATSVSVPPFAGAGRAGKPGSNPFAAALSGLRPTDVFSQTAFPPMAEPAFKAQPIDVPPITSAKPGGSGLAPLPGSDSGAPPLKTDGDAIAAAPPPPRPMAPRPTAAMLANGAADKRPWWKNVRVLLPLLILLIIAAVVVIIRFIPQKTVVHGTLQIKGIEDRDLGVYARREQINRVRKDLTSPELREAVTQRLISQGIQPGFVRSEEAMASLADPSNSPFEDGSLTFQWPQENTQDDARMRAVLQTLYLTNKTAAEQTAEIRREAATAAEKAKATGARRDIQHQELNKLADQVKATGGAAIDLLADPAAAVTALQQQDVALHHAIVQTSADVAGRHDEWQQAQDAAHQSDAAANHKILQFRENLAHLNAQLTVASVSGSGQIDPAKVLDNALSDLDGLLTPLAMAGSKDTALANYTSTARQAVAQIRAWLDGTNQDAARIDDLQQQLAAHREAHLRQVFAADETLKGLLEERDAQAHRFGAASDSGYAQDAARIQGIVDELDQKTEARRQSLATTGQSSDELQQRLDQTIEQLRDDQRDKQSKIAAALARLDIPAAGKVSLNDEPLLDEIGKDVAQAKADYDQYARGTKPSGQDSAGEVQKLRAEIAEQQAQLDAYEQHSDANGAVATARQALDAAQAAQAKAQAAYAANLNQLTLARRYHDQQMLYNDSSTAHETAAHDAQAKAAEAGATPILLPPGPNAVQLVSQPDQRVWYLAGAIGLIVLLFAVPLWMAIREPRTEQVPYANPTMNRDIRGNATHDENFPLLDDDEHPALT